MKKRLKEILARKKEIRSILTSDKECNIDELEKELRSLEDEQSGIEKRQEIANSINDGTLTDFQEITKPFEKRENVYGVDSKEYRSAFFKTLAGVELNDVEKRAMTTNANSAGVAVPTQIGRAHV